MDHLKLGIVLESLGLPLRRALMEAEKMGAAGIQVDAVGPLSPNQLSETGRREFLHLLRGHGLQVTAVGCPLRRGLDVAEDQQPRIEHVKKVMTLSFDLGARMTIVQAGRVPEKEDDPRFGLLREAMLALGSHGDRIGAVLALDTGLESGADLRAWLDRFDTGGLGANLDPANLLMHGFDPIRSIFDLREKIVHAHARDARGATASGTAQEVPLGHGDIEWMSFLATLDAIEYRGWLDVERESGDNRLADVAAGVGFLRRFLR